MEVENVDCDTDVEERQNTNVENGVDEDVTKIEEKEDVELDNESGTEVENKDVKKKDDETRVI